MFVLNGKPLAFDRPFEANGTLFPANWLRLSSTEAREAIGITWVPDPPAYDTRFYWGYTASGTLIPKDHDQLVTEWTDTTRQAANNYLAPTDWMVIREADNGTVVPSGLKAWRQDIRYACEGKVTMLSLTTDTFGLAEYVTYVSPSGGAPSDYNYWPRDPSSTPIFISDSASDGLEPLIDVETAGPISGEAV
jgi:hypothetical protein